MQITIFRFSQKVHKLKRSRLLNIVCITLVSKKIKSIKKSATTKLTPKLSFFQAGVCKTRLYDKPPGSAINNSSNNNNHVIYNVRNTFADVRSQFIKRVLTNGANLVSKVRDIIKVW